MPIVQKLELQQMIVKVKNEIELVQTEYYQILIMHMLHVQLQLNVHHIIKIDFLVIEV